MLSGQAHRALAPRRAKRLALLALATLLLHASLLGGLARGWEADPLPAERPAMQVRLLTAAAPDDDLPAPSALPVGGPADTAAQTPIERATPKPGNAPPAPPALAPVRLARAAAEASTRLQPAPEATPVPAVEPVARFPGDPSSERVTDAMLAALAMAADEPVPETGADTAPNVPAPGDRPPPTLLPPALTVDYDMHRGLMRGSAELRWQPHDGAYDLALDARLAGFSVMRQSSQGDLGEAGIAPRRFTDQRAGREVRATNFQREAGKVTFSGPAVVFQLEPGMQDRLSWMVQLAALVAADAHRREAGAEIGMTVVGARADLANWVFRYVGRETIETPLGPVSAEKFVRQRRDPYDTEVEVWLDPLHHHLPARAVLRNGPDDVVELLLRRIS